MKLEVAQEGIDGAGVGGGGGGGGAGGFTVIRRLGGKEVLAT